jgi:dethiobiotin synthetase
MTIASIPGLFITGTDTGVGKTQVACRIARWLVRAGYRVGVYKPAASGCSVQDGQTIAEDAELLWQAAGRPGDGQRVCPQRFLAPLAPPLAARAEGRKVDAAALRSGLDFWKERSEIVLVEGAGGLMSPLSDEDYVADLAEDCGFPLIVVAPNVLGVINQTLQTLITAATFRNGLPIAGIVLNELGRDVGEDPSVESNYDQLVAHCVPPVLARLSFDGDQFVPEVDWFAVAKTHPRDEDVPSRERTSEPNS